MKCVHDVLSPVRSDSDFEAFSFSKHSGNDSPEPRAFADVKLRVGYDGQRQRKAFDVGKPLGGDGFGGREAIDNEASSAPDAEKTQGGDFAGVSV